METLTCKDNRLYSILVLYKMHSDFFHKALEGINDDDAHNRLGTKANHIAWIAGSLVEQRFELANLFGIEENQAAHDLFKNNQGIKEDVRYPSPSDYKTDWDKITPLLQEALENASPEKLDASFEMMPEMKMTYFDMVSFCTYREANCIGQIALLRRQIGHEAMKYM